MTNRTLVVSIDALITADIPVLKQLPNLGRVMEHASWITDIECIYLPDEHILFTSTRS